MYLCPVCTRVYAGPGRCKDDGAELESSIESGRAPRNTADDDSLVGRTVGSYRIERLIGRGGMGNVYLGVQPNIGSRVAVKVLTGSARPGSKEVERFFAEARAVNFIRHDGLVNVIDLAHLADGRPYIVMEYLEGSPLSAYIAAGPLPLGTLIEIMVAVLDALAAAHATGIIHRDLKPDNVFVTTTGRTKVLDFGIAKLKPELAGVTPQTHTGALLGTPHYMSPEQARGLSADHRSDIYQVGVMLFEAVTGRRLFEADALYNLLHQHIAVAPPSASSLRGDVPPSLDAIIARCLEKDPERRFQSAAELAQALMDVSRFLPEPSFVPISPAPHRQASLRPAAGLAATAGPIPPTLVPAQTLVATAVSPPKKQTSVAVPLLAVGGIVAVLAILGSVALLVLWQVRDEPKRSAVRGNDGEIDDPPPDRDYDPKSFDALAFLPKARRAAKKEYSDAELIQIVINGVGPDGRSRLANGKFTTYVFRSPSHSPKTRDRQQVIFDECVVQVIVTPSTVTTMLAQGNCAARPLPKPHCTMRQVTHRAGLNGNMEAIVSFVPVGLEAGWQVLVGSDAQQFVDDC